MNIIHNTTNLDLAGLKRSEEVTKEYKKKLQEIKDSGKTPSQYIIEAMFTQNEDYRFIENEYPYKLSKDFTHCLLWAKQDHTMQNVDWEWFCETLERGETKVIAIWENSHKKKSVTGIKHYHVIIKSKEYA